MSELAKLADFVSHAAGAALKQIALPSILEAIESDHASLRALIRTLKSESATPLEREEAFAEFRQLLKSHSKAEEKSVYPYCLKVAGMETMSHEGFAEHALASAELAKIPRIRDEAKKRAHLKVLAELVEHHMGEEERSFLPGLRQKVESEQLEKLRTKFLKVRRETQPHPDAENSGVLVA